MFMRVCCLSNTLVRPTGSGTGVDGPAEALAALDDPIVAGFTMASMASSSSLLDPSWNGLDMMWWRQLLAADGRKLHAAYNSLAKQLEQKWLRLMVFHIPDDMLDRGGMRQTVMHHLPMHTTTVQHIIRISHSLGARRSHPGYFAVWM